MGGDEGRVGGGLEKEKKENRWKKRNVGEGDEEAGREGDHQCPFQVLASEPPDVRRPRLE